MSDVASPGRNKLWSTPMRDLLRGRVTGRLDWKSQLLEAGLPAPATQLIHRVVGRTRLWRLERTAVANELIAHFQDALAAGSSADDMVGNFGDERTAAKLIRRAKRRGRPLPWHVWNFTLRATLILVGIYAVLFVRFCVGQPTPSVDYVAQLNAPLINISQDQRAWPTWHEAIIASSDGMKDGVLSVSDAVGGGGAEQRPWAETVDWLDHHTAALELARQAGRKPVFGFVLGPRGSQVELGLTQALDPDAPLISVLLPHLNYLRQMAIILSLDARRAAELHNGARIETDLVAMFGLARQLRESDGFLVTELVALGIDSLTVDRLENVVRRHPEALSDAQLIEFAHTIARPRVAADLVSIKGERFFFSDVVQRFYTDNGHGDGRMTLKGARSFPSTMGVGGSKPPVMNALNVLSAIPLIIASRAELTEKYNQLMDLSESNLQQPLRLVDWGNVSGPMDSIRQSSIDSAHYLLLCVLFPTMSHVQASCERYLGARDGALVGIGLEIYHRRHGRYPVSLGELTPQLLPEIPADRITGDPVKYRLIDGKPVIYSVGVDRLDDGGVRGKDGQPNPADWSKPAPANAKGDWVLYPPLNE